MLVDLGWSGKLVTVTELLLAAAHGATNTKPEITGLVFFALSEKENEASTLTTNKFYAARITVSKEIQGQRNALTSFRLLTCRTNVWKLKQTILVKTDWRAEVGWCLLKPKIYCHAGI